MQNIAYDNFVEQLLTAAPEFRDIHRQHVKDNDEVLPHVLLGEVTRFVIEAHRRANIGLRTRILDFLESAISSQDGKLQELIAVSFLENLHQAGDDYEEMKELLGPNLRKNVLLAGE